MTKQRLPARAAIFDLGNVVVDFDRTSTYRAIAGALNQDHRVVQGILERSDLRQRYEVGDVETPAFRAELRGILGCVERVLPYELLDESWSIIFAVRPEMVEVPARDVQVRGVVRGLIRRY